MNKGDFADYIRALKAHDYAGFSKYYGPDFRAYMAGGVFDSDGAVAFERTLADFSSWTMDVRQVVADADCIALEAVMDIELTSAPPPDFPLPPAKAGDRFKFHFCAFYTLRDGKIAQLRVLPFSTEPQ